MNGYSHTGEMPPDHGRFRAALGHGLHGAALPSLLRGFARSFGGTAIGTLLHRIRRTARAAGPDTVTEEFLGAMQHVVLAGLNRSGFFAHGAFCGDGCLRIVYGAPVFTERIECCLLEPCPDFSIEACIGTLIDDFHSFGLDVEISTSGQPRRPSGVSIAPLCDPSIVTFAVRGEKALRMTLRVDPCAASRSMATEEHLIPDRLPFRVRCGSLPYLFACKVTDLLSCSPKDSPDGSAWIVFSWFVRNGVQLDLACLADGALPADCLQGEGLSDMAIRNRLHRLVDSMDVASVLDAAAMAGEHEGLPAASGVRRYFHQLAGAVGITTP